MKKIQSSPEIPPAQKMKCRRCLMFFFAYPTRHPPTNQKVGENFVRLLAGGFFCVFLMFFFFALSFKVCDPPCRYSAVIWIPIRHDFKRDVVQHHQKVRKCYRNTFAEGTWVNGRKPRSRGICPPVLDRTTELFTVEVGERERCGWIWLPIPSMGRLYIYLHEWLIFVGLL